MTPPQFDASPPRPGALPAWFDALPAAARAALDPLPDAAAALGEVTVRREHEMHVTPDLPGVHTVTLRRPAWRSVAVVAFHLDADTAPHRSTLEDRLGAGVALPIPPDQLGARDFDYPVPDGWALPAASHIVVTAGWDDVVSAITVEVPLPD